MTLETAPADTFMTVKEACDSFGISRRTLYNWFEKYQIHTKKRGNKLLVLHLDLMKAKEKSDGSGGYESRRDTEDRLDKTYDLLKTALNTLQDELRVKNKVIEEYTVQRTNALLLEEARTIEAVSKKKSRAYRVGFFLMSVIAIILLVLLWSTAILQV